MTTREKSEPGAVHGPERIVVVGGGPAGRSTARRACRDAGGRGEVTIVAAEAHLVLPRDRDEDLEHGRTLIAGGGAAPS